MDSDSVFNPLDKRNLGKSIVDALLSAPALPLGTVAVFPGAGVYAIYYSGTFEPYLPLAALNAATTNYPIYVGKAIPKGGRKGLSADSSLRSKAMSQRLREHRISIECTPTLAIEDFTFRSLVVDDVWITLGEALLIQQYQPLWNHVVEGFGNHSVGKGRFTGMRPLWDELHPGRTWALKCKPPKLGREAILGAVGNYMKEIIGAS